MMNVRLANVEWLQPKEQSGKRALTPAASFSLVRNSRPTRLDVTSFNGQTHRLIPVDQGLSHPFNQTQISQTLIILPIILLLHSQTKMLPLTHRNVIVEFRL